MDKFKERLRIAMKDESVNAFADRSGVAETVLRKYLIGPTLPGLVNLVAIANTAKVNIAWLASGEGPKSIHEKSINVDFLSLVLKIYEDYEKELGAVISHGEKALSISMIYDFWWKEGREFEDIIPGIRIEVEFFHDFFRAYDQLKKSGVDAKRFAEVMRDISREFWSEEDADSVVDRLTRSKILKDANKGKKR
jgi:transcriptional regulator with XRE-family HTH domain